jgi:hypothetical protein
LREFVERWWQEPMEDVGGPIKKARHRYRGARAGIDPETNEPMPMVKLTDKVISTFPPSVQAWIGFFRDMDNKPPKRRFFFDADGCPDHRMVESASVLELVSFSEPPFSYSVRKADFHLPDPYVTALDAEYRTFSGQIAHVTTLALQYIMSESRGNSGFCIQRDLNLNEKFIADLRSALPVHAVFDNALIFEGHNMVATCNADLHMTCIRPNFRFRLRSPATRDDVPGFLWEHARNSNDQWGIFFDELFAV